MTQFIEQFYYGNIEPQELTTELKAEVKRKLSNLTQAEDKLTAALTEAQKELFAVYVSRYNELIGVCNADSFIAGFRLGAKFTYNTFVD